MANIFENIYIQIYGERGGGYRGQGIELKNAPNGKYTRICIYSNIQGEEG